MSERQADPLPPVSVVICTADRSDMIGRAVRSVLDQEYPELELLVVDQSTGDATD